MALNLDARQRAMLEAMGITVWLPSPEESFAAEAVATTAMAAVDDYAPAATHAQPPQPMQPVQQRPQERQVPPPAAAAVPSEVQTSAQPAAPAVQPPRSKPAPIQPPAQVSGATPITQGSAMRPPRAYVQQPAAGPAGEPGAGWSLGAAQLVYPQSTQHIQAPAQGGWLILLEPPANPLPLSPAQKPGPGSAQTALEGDAARLLDNMLRALNLQERPRVFSAALHRPPVDAQLAAEVPPLQPALQDLLQELRPDCVLVLGLASARAVLGRHDALGRLRAEPHRIAGVPTVVSYDPNYLLRAPQAKAGAWADLCAAQAFTTTS